MPLNSTFTACSSRGVGLRSRIRKLITLTVTSSRTWIAPATTARLETLVGNGQAGEPANPGRYMYVGRRYAQSFYHDNDGTIGVGTKTLENTEYFETAQTPRPNSSTRINYSWGYEIIEYSHTVNREIVGASSATTGSSASAFGVTFPGGSGGAAGTISRTDVAVVPGQSYLISVPSGAQITITYFE